MKYQSLCTQQDRIVIYRRGVVIVTTTKLHSTKSELKFCAGSNPA